MQGWILNSVGFVRNFTTCRCFCFLGIILYSDKIFYSPTEGLAGHNRGHPRCNIIHWFVFFVLWTIVRVRFIVKDVCFLCFKWAVNKIIGRSWAKYRNLSVASRSIICRSRRLRQNNWCARDWQIAIFCDNRIKNCFIIRPPSLFFLTTTFGKQSHLPFFTQERSQEGEAWFRLRMSRILFAAKHSWTTLRMSRPLFVGSYLQSRGGLSANEREEKFSSNDNKIYYTRDKPKTSRTGLYCFETCNFLNRMNIACLNCQLRALSGKSFKLGYLINAKRSALFAKYCLKKIKTFWIWTGTKMTVFNVLEKRPKSHFCLQLFFFFTQIIDAKLKFMYSCSSLEVTFLFLFVSRAELQPFCSSASWRCLDFQHHDCIAGLEIARMFGCVRSLVLCNYGSNYFFNSSQLTKRGNVCTNAPALDLLN